MKHILILALIITSAIALAQDVHVKPRVAPKSPAPAEPSAAPTIIMPPLEFRGFRPNMSLEEAHQRYIDRVIPGIQDEFTKIGWGKMGTGDWHCTQHTNATMACIYSTGRRAAVQASFQAWFLNDKLVMASWTMPKAEFDSIKTALIDKFGPATSARQASYQNRMGAEFNGEQLLWKNEGSSLNVEELGETVDSMRITLQDDAATKKYLAIYQGKPDI